MDESLPSWLSFSPMAGNVNSGDSLQVTVQADGTNLGVGSYNHYCDISSNDLWAHNTGVSTTFHVSSLPLVADFHADILTGHPSFHVSFTDDSRTDPAHTWSTINSWKWDFNNDGVFDPFVQNPSYEYTTPGVYSVRLVIRTNTGAVSSKLRTDYINMINNPPEAIDSLHTITMEEDTQWGPEYIMGLFNDPDNDPLTLSCDGSEHLTATVSYQFLTLIPAPDWHGTETITIIASDPFGESVQHEIEVTVTPVNDAPVLSIPEDLYFIRNSVYIVDFAPYIDDPDNPDEELSLQIMPVPPEGDINFVYTPIDVANTVGQLTVAFSSPSQIASSATFSIAVNDNMGRLIATTTFTMHVLEQFTPDIEIGDSYEFAGQTVAFTDVTLGNPDHWLWEFGDGSSSELRNPEHQYLVSGTYDIRLTLGNSQVPEEDRMVFIPGMITLSGTAVTVTDIPDTWTVLGSPYNLFGDVVIDSTATVTVEDDVVVNLFSEAPLHVRGAILANGVRFQPQSGSGRWGGIKFSGSGLREPSSLANCQIIDAIVPVDIATQSPVLSNLYIAVSDTTALADGEAIKIFESSCQISDAEILNYRAGITVDGHGPSRATPTLSNIRVRNSSNTQRTEDHDTIGVTLKSFATVDSLEVDNCSTGIIIGSDNETYSSTPTLSNIRVRNSSNTQRTVLQGTGILITGNAAPNLTDVNVSEVANGIVIDDITSMRATPTLTNIRVRNSSNTTRSITNGLIIRNTPNVLITDAWFDDFATGISIEADNRAASTPTLVNIRVRNSSNTQRTETCGIKITGSVNASMDDVEIEDYMNGLSYTMTNHTRAAETVTLSNIRVRNSSNTQRQVSTGAEFSGVEDLRITDMQIDDYSVGLKISASDTRATATPTLVNIRVRNSSNTQREENTSIFLGQGVRGSMQDSVVEEATIGILIAEGNQTVLENNQIINCKTGLRATGTNPLPLRKQLFAMEDAYLLEFPGEDYCAFELYGAGPWSLYQNTISGYAKGVKATNANVNFHTNILWTTGQELTPFVNNSSTIQSRYNNIYRSEGLHPGIGNINSDPLFALPAERNFSLNRNSPCIDAGNPEMAFDADGTIADMGYLAYLHSASAVPSTRFVVVGSQVDFTNISCGHDFADTQIEWDIGNDASIEGTDYNFSYIFDNPGLYDLRLRMQSGDLIDEKAYPGMIAVSSDQLLAPQNPALTRNGNDIVFTWDAVSQTVEGIPYVVPFYLIYKSDSPDGFYHYTGFTIGSETSFTDHDAALDSKAFYLVLGYTGTRAEMLNFVETNTMISRKGVRLLKRE
ncbi:MAG: PKD domain-containing protein [Candidatus Cloacimonetes bacterium]|nr:PKD domain-containing protein [Candidatus Cloacimonadota bacterium]MCK9177689.1 PKD domain-containing protein [Candidatus Cloacimonadota bacterium]